MAIRSNARELTRRRGLNRGVEAAIWTAAGLLVVACVLFVERPRGMLAGYAFNASHVVLSGILAGATLRLARRFLPRVGAAWGHYVLALVMVLFVGVGIEIAQMFVAGSPSMTDVVLDLMGGSAILCWAAASDARVRAALGRYSSAALRVVAMGLLAAALSPIIELGTEWLQQRRAFPTLAHFDAWPGRHFVKAVGGADLSKVRPPAGFTRGRGRVAALDLSTGKFPRLELVRRSEDWSGYSAFAFDIFVPGPEPVVLHLRVHDALHDSNFTDRFNLRLPIAVGESTVRVPLRQIREGPRDRPLELSRVAGLALFTLRPSRIVRVYVDNLRLE